MKFTEIRTDVVGDDAFGPSGRHGFQPVPGRADRVQYVALGVLAHLFRVQRAGLLPRGNGFARLGVGSAENRVAQVHQTAEQVGLVAAVHLVVGVFFGPHYLHGLRECRLQRQIDGQEPQERCSHAVTR